MTHESRPSSGGAPREVSEDGIGSSPLGELGSSAEPSDATTGRRWRIAGLATSTALILLAGGFIGGAVATAAGADRGPRSEDRPRSHQGEE